MYRIVASMLCLFFSFFSVVLLIFVNQHNAPIVHSSKSILLGPIERKYRLVIPTACPELCPVVFAFHGTGDSATSMAKYSELDALAEEKRFLLVYPEAKRGMWSTVNIDGENLDANEDVQFFDKLILEIQDQQKIDPKRVYLVGMSNGASFVQLLANARSTSITAVVAHSGAKPKPLLEPTRHFPIMLVVGENDTALASMKNDVAAYQNSGHDTAFERVQNLGHQWSTEHNQLIWNFLSLHSLEEKKP